MDGRSRQHARTWQVNASVFAVLFGAALIVLGVAAALMPLAGRDATACLHNITPPAEFVAKYQEGIAATGETISLLPLGAQCSYVATSTGETTLSIVPLWPTIAVLSGLAGIALGVTGLIVSALARL
ncbi:hypothetical protein FBY40_3417 [Microbacterium sp. SLBN-154]|uniref:hypothetical protein n=1 Tax=Microbacterium sp. SLBN-154 TaxID=2768458 RepID=UPI00114E8EE1|nr:hypothetical protein [Microbacterium sp. SLBN-154]TQK20872.1 hypothetical protein FBY40_3417 [Microbacterium sp. SLBN-154]